jgi:AAA family ATP:ADP antiporter
LVLFYLASLSDAIRGSLGLIFHLWVGIFNMMVVAQFWPFANDIYTEEQGKRLFALVGVGAATGAWFGSGISIALARNLGVYQMLLVGAVILVLFSALIHIVHQREKDRPETEKPTKADTTEDAKRGAFGMVFKHKYLVLLAVFHLLFTLVNTNGEYMLGKLIKGAAATAEAAGTLGAMSVGDFIGSQFGEFFFYVNTLTVLIQALVVSRLVKFGGLKLAFLVLPCIALLDAAAVAIIPALFVLRIGKIAENATDYSINNTVRQMLWLPTTREMKYRAKQAVDTFFVRMGDVSSAVVVYIGAGLLAWEVRAFAIVNLVVVVVWLFVAFAILRENKRLSENSENA